MGFDKLDKTKEQAVVTAIEKIIDVSRHSPGMDLNKIAADVFSESDAMTPELARRACEAYNKSKSVYTLQKRASDERAEDFDLIDPEAVNKFMYGYHQKAASEFVMPGRTQRDNIPELRKKLEKVAFDASDSPEPPGDFGVIEREIHRTSIRLERSLGKLKESNGMHKQASEDAIHRACQVMRRLNNKTLHKIARLTVNRYGDDGSRLVQLFSAYIGQDLPIEKTANAAIFPLREPYTSIAIAIDEARAFTGSSKMLEKTAEYVPDTLKKHAAPADAATGALRTTKSSLKRLLDPVIDFAKSPVYSEIQKEHDTQGDVAFDATLQNQLQQLRATQGFVDVASDEFVKDYPIDDAVQAYNNVVGSMPELLDEKYSPWLRALVREQLVQGNVYDANTIKQLQDVGKEIKKGRVQDIDEATKMLEAGKGKTISGFELTPSETPQPVKPAGAPAPAAAAPKSDTDDAADEAAFQKEREEHYKKREEAETGKPTSGDKKKSTRRGGNRGR